jgi:formate-dependent nitrite reductase membrane component NrfD
MIATIETTGAETPAGYYGKPIVEAHVWKDYIGWYFFTGGLAGASSTIAAVAELADRPVLARHARRAALIGLLPSPGLLIADLGRPGRFAYMLRLVKPTSPMSVGSWLLAGYSPFALGSALLDECGRAPRLRRATTVLAGCLGPAIATYTGVLVADTATPVWHEARRELPALFASSAAASAGAVTTMLSAVSGRPDRSASRVATVGALSEVAVGVVMRRRLGDLDTYRSDAAARRLDRASRSLSLGGATLLVVGRKRRLGSCLGGLAISAGSVCERLAVLRAGTASANDPRSVLRTSS